MKNIYVLPSAKPSKLSINCQTGLLQLGVENRMFHDNINIYITSDKGNSSYCIKECFMAGIYIDRCGCQGFTFTACSNKIGNIILTTDEDLIKDGIQAIDNNFIEWFVKNPACEFVKTLYHYPTICDDGDYSLNSGYYTITLPKEEPAKTEINWSGFPKSTQEKVGYKEPKQETLEEAAEKFRSENPGTMQGGNNTKILNAFIAGTKWQSERLYSEGEVLEHLNLLYSMKNSTVDTFTDKHDMITMKWFEQFKKK